MKVNTVPVTKSQLLDYVTKFEFNEFKEEMRDFKLEMHEFRLNTESRFNSIDKRFDSIDRRFDRLSEEFRIHTGVVLQQMREYFDATKEYMNHIEEKKMDK